MTTFRARQEQRTHCVVCGAARVAHEYDTLTCPTSYRPDSLAIAERELAAAVASGDAHRIFIARGEVQRLGGRP